MVKVGNLLNTGKLNGLNPEKIGFGSVIDGCIIAAFIVDLGGHTEAFSLEFGNFTNPLFDKIN